MKRLPSAEQKLLLLYTLSELGASTDLQLLQFMVELGLMDYIELRLALCELVDSEQLKTKDHPLGTLYQITAKGREALELFEKRVRASSRELVTKNCAEWKTRFAREKSVVSELAPQPGGEYLVKIHLMEQDLPLMQLSISVPSRDMANAFLRRCDDKAESIYLYCMKTLGGDE
ncbi:MAG: DUF4364 family protein [Eubacteriales bacterium]|nr:DUF4364 family protein [Eubacteriales bacterium]MDD3881272.1 DUF4364 family protein [Eubacteriales bacterium]MDD4512190.1 DUF4364 family protein [Eubacteriales bacterium]